MLNLAKELRLFGFDSFIVCSNKDDYFNIEGIDVFGCIPPAYMDAYCDYGESTEQFLSDHLYGSDDIHRALYRISEYSDYQLSCHTADVFHMNSFASCIFSSHATPKILTIHDNENELDEEWFIGAHNKIAEIIRLDKNALKDVKIFTPSKYYAEQYTRKFLRRVLSTPIGVPVDFCRWKRMDKTNRRLSDKNNVNVLMPSRFTFQQKGQDVALLALSHIRENYPNIQANFTFSGVTKHYSRHIPSFLAKADELGVSSSINITRFEDMHDAYSQADVVVSPERYCSYGISISESLSLGIPTVLSSIPTYVEIALESPHAIFVDIDDHHSLANGIMSGYKMELDVYWPDVIRFRLNNDLRKCVKFYINQYLSVQRYKPFL